jgi:hypothetical protein
MEYDVSSTTTSGDKDFSVNTTAAIDDVKITLFTEAAFLQEPRTFSVPLTAGSINSTLKNTLVMCLFFIKGGYIKQLVTFIR